MWVFKIKITNDRCITIVRHKKCLFGKHWERSKSVHTSVSSVGKKSSQSALHVSSSLLESFSFLWEPSPPSSPLEIEVGRGEGRDAETVSTHKFFFVEVTFYVESRQHEFKKITGFSGSRQNSSIGPDCLHCVDSDVESGTLHASPAWSSAQLHFLQFLFLPSVTSPTMCSVALTNRTTECSDP